MKEVIKKCEEKMTKTCESLDGEFMNIRAGRANPHVLDQIRVDYYGAPTAIQQVANVSVPEARMIMIQPWEASMVKAIEKAIMTSDLGINPTNDGKCIRLVFPELTEERSKDLANDALKKMGKAGDVSEDEIKDLETQVQKLTDKYIADVDAAVTEKTKEIMTV